MMDEKHIIVNTKLGKLKGNILQSEVFGKTYYAFQGIPYAKPPIGELRFKAPQPYGSWDGVRDATKDGNSCKQDLMIKLPNQVPSKVAEGDEDCLFLNVYTNEPPNESSHKKPVMFNIHGGGFLNGSGGNHMCGCDYLMSEDIVMVSINYRCNAFGFLSLEIEQAPGNAGMKDQVMALKWVRDNIQSFGGDPNNVTIFGISAGGASVDLLLLSPLSKGLFHKAILQSGFSTNPWVIQQSPRERALELARALGCKEENPHKALEFLQSVPADDIITASKTVADSKLAIETISRSFTPSVEVAGDNPFLADFPVNVLKEGKFNQVPVILGCAEREGSVAAFFRALHSKEFEAINNNLELLVPSFLKLKPGSVEKKIAAKEILKHYMEGKPITWDNVEEYVKYHSDFLFNIGMGTTRSGLLEKSSFPVYTYLFANHSRCICSFSKVLFPDAEHPEKLTTKEACHGADSMFVLCMKLFPSTEMAQEIKEAVRRHVKVWATFAATGDPNCEELGTTWQKDSENHPCYLEMGNKWEMKKGALFAERLEFWKTLTAKYCKAL